MIMWYTNVGAVLFLMVKNCIMKIPAFVAFILLSIGLFAQVKNDEFNYLATHSATWNGSFNNVEKVLDKELLTNQVILIGENHGIKATYDVEFALVEYLKAKTGFKYLLQELGFLDGIYLNQYLYSGDEKYLKQFFDLHKRTFFWNKSGADFYKRLYQLNLHFPPGDRIQLLPVDLEFAHRDAIAYLQDHVFSKDDKGKVEELLYSIHPKDDSARLMIKVFAAVHQTFINDTTAYRKKLDSKFDDAISLIGNIYERYAISVDNNADTRRDSVMLNNFNFWKKKYSITDDKVVGIFGNFHVRQLQQSNDTRFAALLKNDTSIQGVTSISFLYQNCEMMWKNYLAPNDTAGLKNLFVKRKVVNNGSLDEPISNLEMLGAFDKDQAILFKLAGKNSPFNQSTSFLKKSETFATTANMFQVLVLINHSPATEPYGGVEDY
jgi:hypothetical protein